jgi:hypothetical protein
VPDEGQPLIVSFTGGIGAQILSLGIVFDQKDRGLPCGIDLTYFNQTPKLARPGDGVSIWRWGLEYLGYTAQYVMDLADLEMGDGRLLSDSPEKLQLGIEALSKPLVRNRFPSQSTKLTFQNVSLDSSQGATPYATFHIRRGDFLNVASWLVPDEHYIGAARSVSKIVSHAILVSDSAITFGVLETFQALFADVSVLDGGNGEAGEVHHLLRNSLIHVGSNGQFSLTAGLLSESLYLAPKKFLGGKSESEVVLSSLSSFAVVAK